MTSKPTLPTTAAERVVKGKRHEDYGDFLKSLKTIAALWQPKLKGHKVTAHDVAWCLVQLKMAREANNPKWDNRVDICGYIIGLDLASKKETKDE